MRGGDLKALGSVSGGSLLVAALGCKLDPYLRFQITLQRSIQVVKAIRECIEAPES